MALDKVFRLEEVEVEEEQQRQQSTTKREGEFSSPSSPTLIKKSYCQSPYKIHNNNNNNNNKNQSFAARAKNFLCRKDKDSSSNNKNNNKDNNNNNNTNSNDDSSNNNNNDNRNRDRNSSQGDAYLRLYEEQQEQQQYNTPTSPGGTPLPTQSLIPCIECGRKFNEKAYEKHRKVCNNVFNSKRKVFDSTKARMTGTDLAQFNNMNKDNKKNNKKNRNTNANANNHNKNNSNNHDDDREITGAMKKIPKWKVQSEQFRAIIKQNRLISEAEKTGKPLSSVPTVKPKLPSGYIDGNGGVLDDDLIPCPNCGRRFNEKAADRHLPICKNIKAKPKSLQRGGGTRLGVGSRNMEKKKGRGRGFM